MPLQIIKHWGPLLIIAALMIIAFMSGWHEKISLETIQENRENLSDFVAKKPILTALSFFGAYTVFVSLSLPAATLLTLLGGFLFGKWLGTLYVVSAATLGATIIFFVAKTSLGKTLRTKAGKIYQKIENNMKENAAGYMLFMRLVPLFPFFLVNIVPALFNVRSTTYIWTTFLGIIPGSFVYVNLGEQLGEIENLNDLVSLETILAIALLGLFALIPTLYKQFKNKKAMASIGLLGLILAWSPGTAQAKTSYDQFLTYYDALLSSYVTPTTRENITFNGVNYDGWAQDPQHAQALILLLKINPAQFKSKNEKISFWVNVYNFLTIDLIVRENERNSIKNLGTVFSSPWKAHNWGIGEKDYTLDYIEHKILRSLGDERIHFAINCASLSCPDLRSESYRSSKLNTQLDQQVKITLKNKTKGLKHEANTIHISKIFSWFDEDFNDGDIRTWLSHYIDIKKEDAIEYMHYNWKLNKK